MVFIDAIFVKIRDGQVANRPIYVAIGVTVDGERDILGLWAGQGGEGAKYWLTVLTEIKNRGVADVCIVCCDGLKGLPDSISATWPLAIVQTCVLHLIRHTFRLAGRHDWEPIAKALRPVYTAPTEAAARERFAEFTAMWGAKYPGIIRLWDIGVGRVRAVPGVRGRGPPSHLLDERDRVAQRPVPARRPSPRALPDRASRVEMPLPGDPIP